MSRNAWINFSIRVWSKSENVFNDTIRYMGGQIVLFGNVTIDHNIIETGKYTGPGGSVYFGGRTAENLGMLPTIVSPYGKDFPKHFLSKTRFYPKNPTSEKTLIFENIHHSDGTRTQKVREWCKQRSLAFADILSSLPSHPACIMIAPILNNITSREIKNIGAYFSKSLKVFLPQGLYRLVGEGGHIEKQDWEAPGECISLFDIIVTSEKDGIEIEEKVRKWSTYGPIAIVTRGENGCSLYRKGERTDIPAFSVSNIVDSTGAGDIFAVSLSFAYLRKQDIFTSIAFAHAGAGYSLRFTSNQLQYRENDILAFAKERGRSIHL